MPNVVIGNRSSICTLLVDKTPKQFYQLTYAPSMYIYIRRVLDWHIRPPGLYPLGFATINNLFPPYQMGLFQHSRAFHVLRHMVYRTYLYPENIFLPGPGAFQKSRLSNFRIFVDTGRRTDFQIASDRTFAFRFVVRS